MDIVKENLIIKEQAFKISKSIIVDQNYLIPDVKQDFISNTLINGNVFISKTEIQSGKLKVEGTVNIYDLYLNSEESNSNLDLVIPFSEIIKFDDDMENVQNTDIKSSCKIKDFKVKPLNERKVQFITELDLKLIISNSKNVEIITDIKNANDNIEAKKVSENIESLVGYGRNSGRVKESLKITDVEKIAGIIKINYRVENIENKISYNKVLVKADIGIEVFYRNEENRIGKKNNTVQFMTFIDIPDIKETNYCNTQVNILNSNINIVSDTNIETDLECEAVCDVYEAKEISYINDFYGIKKRYKYDKNEINYSSSEKRDNIKQNLQAKVLIDNINNLYDTNTKLYIQSKSYQDNVTKFLCICETEYIYDVFDGKNIESLKNNIDFTLEFEGNVEEIDLSVSDSSFIILPDSTIDTRIEVATNIKECSSKSISVIKNIEETDEIGNEYSMVIYFVQKDDTLWQIAKDFQTTIESISKINNIQNADDIKEGRRLYIPRTAI